VAQSFIWNGYGVLRDLSKSTELNQALPLNFNYLGQVAAVEDQLLGKAQFLTQQVRAVESERPSVWEINASIQTGKLHLHWTYSKQLHREASIHGLLAILEEQLKAIIAHCLQAEETAYTPSDFPEVNLNQDELDHLLGELL
ncbi:MAG: condensation domain-containing protein, partial [Bacteroidota bacterium]